MDEFDYRIQTTISKREINSILNFGFIDSRENIIFIGPPDVSKTHLAIGLGLKAIENGYKVHFRLISYWRRLRLEFNLVGGYNQAFLKTT